MSGESVKHEIRRIKMSKYVYATLFKWNDQGDPEEDGYIAVAPANDFHDDGEMLDDDICLHLLRSDALDDEDEIHYSIPLGKKNEALSFLKENPKLISHSEAFQKLLREYGENGGAYGWEAD